MLKLKSVLLGIVTLVCPVFLAACYGPPNGEWEEGQDELRGKVVDSVTQLGINRIVVDCRVEGESARAALTDLEGVFVMPWGLSCDSLLFRDVDGLENGGEYAELEAPLSELGDDFIFELDKIDG